MATLKRNGNTDQYYIEILDAGEPVVSHIPPAGVQYLQENGIEEGGEISAEMMSGLWSNGFLAPEDEISHAFYVGTDSSVEDHPPVENETETNAPNIDARAVSSEILPSTHMQPRPWMEQENVEAFREGTEPSVADSGQAEKQARWTQADRAGANPMTHPEDAAFVGNVWFWVLVVALMVIVVWTVVEIF